MHSSVRYVLCRSVISFPSQFQTNIFILQNTLLFPSTFLFSFAKFGLCLYLGVDLMQISVKPRWAPYSVPSWSGTMLRRALWRGSLEMALEFQSFGQQQILLAFAQRHPRPWLWPEPFAHSLFGWPGISRPAPGSLLGVR